MSLYLLYSDPHLCDRAPSSCTETYTDDLFDLLEQVSQVAAQRKVKAVACAGDFWHLKSPSRTSHKLVQRAIRTLKSCPVPYYIVPGNHDLTHDRFDSIHQTQPLGVLFESGAARCLDGWADSYPEVVPLYGVPWLQGYGEHTEEIDAAVGQALRGYREVARSWQELPEAERGTVPVHHLVIAHVPLYPPGQESPYEWFPAERWAEAMGMQGGGRHSVFYGHVHEPHGTYGFYGDGDHGPYSITFCNNGALSRGSLHEYNLTRQVGCTLWDDETGEFEFVPLDAKPAEEVFRLAERQAEAGQRALAEEFLAGIGAANLEAVSVESVIAHIRTLGLPKDAEDLAAELLTEAAHG